MQYLFSDQPLEASGTIPECEPLCVMSGGSRMHGSVLYPYGKFTEGRPCVIFFHGFPGTTRSDDIANALCRVGCVVVTLHHRGAWGSEGKYLVTNCIEDAEAALRHVRSAEFAEKYKIDTNAVFLMGHSMGGCTIINAVKRMRKAGDCPVRGLILMAPYDPSFAINGPVEESTMDALPDELRALFVEDYSEFKAFLAEGASVLHCDGVDALFEDIRGNADALRFSDAAESLYDINVICLAGMLDSVAPPHNMVTPLWGRMKADGALHRLKEYPAGHSLHGFRCTASEDIAEFIRDCLAGRTTEQSKFPELKLIEA